MKRRNLPWKKIEGDFLSLMISVFGGQICLKKKIWSFFSYWMLEWLFEAFWLADNDHTVTLQCFHTETLAARFNSEHLSCDSLKATETWQILPNFYSEAVQKQHVIFTVRQALS